MNKNLDNIGQNDTVGLGINAPLDAPVNNNNAPNYEDDDF